MSHSIVSSSAKLGANVQLGDFCKIHDRVVIEDDCTIGDYCTLGVPSTQADGAPLVIRKRSLIRSYSIFYEGSEFGDGLITGHRVTVREGTLAGIGLQIGTLSDYQGHMRVGNYVRTHSSVHIGQQSVIEDFVWLFPYVVLTNDPHPPSDGCLQGCHIRRFAVVATHACVLPGVVIGEDSLVAAGAVVSQDVPEGMIAGGIPAKTLGPTSAIKLRDGTGRAAYPWRRHFHRGYPASIVAEWMRENPC